MAAKKKSTQAADEPIVVEEVQEDTEHAGPADQSTDTTNTPATDTPAQPDAHPPAGRAGVTDLPESTTEAEHQPEMEPHDTEQTQPAAANDFFGAPPDEGKGGIPKALIAVALLVVAGGAGAFMFFGGGQFLGANVEATPSPAVEETLSPEPSPEAEEVDLSEFSVRVLNGTGTAGEAGKVKALLEKAGFEDVKTGNAPSEDNTVTTISAKADVPAAALNAVENALKGSFITEVGDALKADSEYDIVVTTGGSIAKDATGSAREE